MREHNTHRIRRGVLVEIPEAWRGQVPSNQTMLQRKSARIEVRAKKKRRLRTEGAFHWNSQIDD